VTLEPDQNPSRWTDHVSVYQEVFEPFSLAFAEIAAAKLTFTLGMSILDVGAGSGGAALALAERGCRVTAIDASPGMIERLASRARMARLDVDALVMDGQALDFADGRFDAAISVFGVILFPDAVRGLAEMRRVVRPGGRIAVVTWTEPESYELAAELRAAVETICGPGPAPALPAQLRYRERAAFEALFRAAGFDAVAIEVHTCVLHARSARWLVERLHFAPGMASMLAGLGSEKSAVTQRFVRAVEEKQGLGPVQFSGKAFVAIAEIR
jgi:SAM-dependent methyltransferase